MLLAVVVALDGPRDSLEILEMALLGEIEPVAELVSAHIGPHICLIVTKMQRCGMLVERGEMIPVPGRSPGSIARPVEVVEDRRPRNEYRIEVIVVAVDVRRADDLDVHGPGRRSLDDDGGDVLIDVGGEHGLDDEHMGDALDRLDNPQIIHIAVPVEVEVGNDIG